MKIFCMICEKKKPVIPPGFEVHYKYDNGGEFSIKIAPIIQEGHFICKSCQELIHKAISDSKCLWKKNLFPKGKK